MSTSKSLIMVILLDAIANGLLMRMDYVWRSWYNHSNASLQKFSDLLYVLIRSMQKNLEKTKKYFEFFSLFSFFQCRDAKERRTWESLRVDLLKIWLSSVAAWLARQAPRSLLLRQFHLDNWREKGFRSITMKDPSKSIELTASLPSYCYSLLWSAINRKQSWKRNEKSEEIETIKG